VGQEVAIFSIQYSDRQLQISKEKIIGAQNINFVHNVPKMGILAPNFVF